MSSFRRDRDTPGPCAVWWVVGLDWFSWYHPFRWYLKLQTHIQPKPLRLPTLWRLQKKKEPTNKSLPSPRTPCPLSCISILCIISKIYRGPKVGFLNPFWHLKRASSTVATWMSSLKQPSSEQESGWEKYLKNAPLPDNTPLSKLDSLKQWKTAKNIHLGLDSLKQWKTIKRTQPREAKSSILGSWKQRYFCSGVGLFEIFLTRNLQQT